MLSSEYIWIAYEMEKIKSMNTLDKTLELLKTPVHQVEFADINRLHRAAVVEIERLLASQFRWISVSQQRPDAGSALRFVRMQSGEFTTWVGEIRPSDCVTHWAPIPPLPEKTQDENDMELFRDWCRAKGFPNNSVCDAFLAGMKLERAKK